MEDKKIGASSSSSAGVLEKGSADSSSSTTPQLEGKTVPAAGPSPHEVAEVSQYQQHRSQPQQHETDTTDPPPAKRLKPTDTSSTVVTSEPKLDTKTPDMAVEEEEEEEEEEESGLHASAPYLPVTEVQHTTSSCSLASSSSEYSSVTSSSAQNLRQASTSPVPTPYAQEVPPAPPSTPASHPSMFSWDATATPLPVFATTSVRNAAMLEQQQLLAEGAATPAPTKEPPPTSATDAATPTAGDGKPSTLPEDFSDWAVGDRYELIRILGRGSYGEVAQAIDLHAGRRDSFVAIKRIQSPFDQEVDAIRLYREIHILRRMRGHECIIQLLDVIQPPTDDIDDFYDLYLVFEYVDTDLYKLVMSPQYLTTEHIQTFLYQMLVALMYIHSFSVIHRDIKPANILLNEDCSLKICDFGLARIVDPSTMATSNTQDDGKSSDGSVPQTPTSFPSPPAAGLTRQLTKHVVTRWYRAPELILIQPYTSAVDIWSLGCILAELLSMQEGNVSGYQDRQPLFPGGFCYPLSGEGDSIKKDERLDQLNVIFKVIGTPSKEDIEDLGDVTEYIESLGKVPGKSMETLFPVSDPAGLDLLKLMLQFNPKRRCTAAEAVDHEFFKGIRRKELERTADGPLEAPAFLSSHKVDLRLVKQMTFEEVIWFRDQGGTRQPP